MVCATGRKTIEEAGELHLNYTILNWELGPPVSISRTTPPFPRQFQLL